MNTSEAKKPKYFRFYRILCIFIGSLLFVSGCIMLPILLFAPGMKELFESANLTLSKVYILLATNLLFIIASAGLFKFKEVARIIIIICSLWSFVEALYYYILGFSATPFISLVNLMSIILIVLYLMIAIYFFRNDVKAYINA